MSNTNLTPDYRNMTSEQLQDETQKIFKEILNKLDLPNQLQISEMVMEYGRASFSHGSNLQKELTKKSEEILEQLF